jgi:hypothetical protein
MIENKQQTALEWYDNEIEKLFNQFTIDKINIYEFRTKRFKLLEQAKEMFEEQIEKAYDDAIMKGRQEDGEQYYNETYGGGEQ